MLFDPFSSSKEFTSTAFGTFSNFNSIVLLKRFCSVLTLLYVHKSFDLEIVSKICSAVVILIQYLDPTCQIQQIIQLIPIPQGVFMRSRTIRRTKKLLLTKFFYANGRHFYHGNSYCQDCFQSANCLI